MKRHGQRSSKRPKDTTVTEAELALALESVQAVDEYPSHWEERSASKSLYSWSVLRTIQLCVSCAIR